MFRRMIDFTWIYSTMPIIVNDQDHRSSSPMSQNSQNWIKITGLTIDHLTVNSLRSLKCQFSVSKYTTTHSTTCQLEYIVCVQFIYSVANPIYKKGAILLHILLDWNTLLDHQCMCVCVPPIILQASIILSEKHHILYNGILIGYKCAPGPGIITDKMVKRLWALLGAADVFWPWASESIQNKDRLGLGICVVFAINTLWSMIYVNIMLKFKVGLLMEFRLNLLFI